jgi:hypothetical protein
MFATKTLVLCVAVAVACFACIAGAAGSTVLNLENEARMLDEMCQDNSNNSTMSSIDCVIRGQMLLSTLSQGML